MLTKLEFILFLNLLLIKGIISYQIIEKYDSEKTSNNYIVLKTSEFDIGDYIYISVTTNYACYDTYLYYDFYASINEKETLTYSDSVDYSSVTRISSYNSFKETYSYKLKKQNSYENYLYLESNCRAPLVFENTENSGETVIIIAIVISIIGFAIIIAIIVCCCKKCKRYRVYGTVPAPITPVYQVSPYVIQPGVGGVMIQPVVNVQPYGVNYIQTPNYAQNINNQYVQYNSTNPVQTTSDYRMDQEIKYEKPH